MQKRNKISLVGSIVVITLALFVVFVVQPVLHRIKLNVGHVFSGRNLEGLGCAIMVYANDYDDNFPQLPGKGPWSKNLGFSFDHQNPDFKEGGGQEFTTRTITASLYLLVREADVSPKSFVCPNSTLKPFEGVNPDDDRSLVDLWDFGPDPYKHISYSYHNPYGRFPVNGEVSEDFAIAADMSPWFKDGDIVPPGQNNKPPQIIDFSDPETFCVGNSTKHSQRRWLWPHLPISNTSQGQFVLFGDCHVMWEKSSDVGVKNDNIFTFWSTTENPTEQDIRNGVNPTSRSKENDAKSKTDSFLAI